MCCSCGEVSELLRPVEDGVDADVPVDAQNASTRAFENYTDPDAVFNSVHTDHCFLYKEQDRTTTDGNTVIGLSTKSTMKWLPLCLTAITGWSRVLIIFASKSTTEGSAPALNLL
jgi:hypothetical protein